MVIFVDIDNTICQTENSDYVNSTPIHDRINKINKLYDDGNTIIYWTARGSRSKIDWSHLTTKQLDQWECKRHNILFDKPSYDLFIDDKTINSDVYFNLSIIDQTQPTQ